MKKEAFGKYTMTDSLIWEQGIRLFAMTNLSENNPFRPLIEATSVHSIDEIRRGLSENSGESIKR
jgi:hypothetical protein